MDLQLTSAVSMVLLLALVVFTMMLHGGTRSSIDEIDPACGTQVQLRSAALNVDTQATAGKLSACKTRNRMGNTSSNPSKQFAQDLQWCMQSFQNANLLTSTNTYCHVCALYQQDDTVLENVYDSLYIEKEPPKPSFIPENVSTQKPEVTLDISQPTAILFVQSKNVTSGFFDLFFGDAITGTVSGGVAAGIFLIATPVGWGVIASSAVIGTGAALGAGTGYLSLTAPTSSEESGIVITPYNRQELSKIGCTTTAVS